MCSSAAGELKKPAVGALGTDKEGLGVAAGGAAGEVLVDIGAAMHTDVLVGAGEVDTEIGVGLGEGGGDGVGGVAATWVGRLGWLGGGIEDVEVATGHERCIGGIYRGKLRIRWRR